MENVNLRLCAIISILNCRLKVMEEYGCFGARRIADEWRNVKVLIEPAYPRHIWLENAIDWSSLEHAVLCLCPKHPSKMAASIDDLHGAG
ncbi:putative diacylglycerol acyltransferase [Anopheles sinensis]|uniref:Putative diacylglycerol acyltransferase n=1 Tax=Anopheles sinensis TaxID=74873 RepID=A0A084VLF2_ANOSI|nr:putative diacylglycerol acyltransferase [Anopheles sinensis]